MNTRPLKRITGAVMAGSPFGLIAAGMIESSMYHNNYTPLLALLGAACIVALVVAGVSLVVFNDD